MMSEKNVELDSRKCETEKTEKTIKSAEKARNENKQENESVKKGSKKREKLRQNGKSAQRNNKTVKSSSQCKHCAKFFSRRSNLTKHLKNIHKDFDYVIENTTYVCKKEGCSGGYSNCTTLRDHLRSKHGWKFPTAIIQLKCEEDFQRWKEEFEKKEKVCFIKGTGTKQTSTNCIDYYYCNRGGIYLSRSSGKRKRRDSAKIGHPCTANIVATMDKSSGSFKVQVCNKHFGHNAELRFRRSSKAKRATVKKIVNLPVSISMENNDDFVSSTTTTTFGVKKRPLILPKNDLQNSFHYSKSKILSLLHSLERLVKSSNSKDDLDAIEMHLEKALEVGTKIDSCRLDSIISYFPGGENVQLQSFLQSTKNNEEMNDDAAVQQIQIVQAVQENTILVEENVLVYTTEQHIINHDNNNCDKNTEIHTDHNYCNSCLL